VGGDVGRDDRGPVLELRFKGGPRDGQRTRVRSETLIGRELADLSLDDREVSRRHAILRPTEGGFEVEDVGSLNGTLVNNVAVTGRRPLRDGDVIEIGQSEIHIGLRAGADDVAAPSEVVGDARLGPYELGEIVRRDGMFTTRKAYQASLDRYVSIKLLNDPQDAQFRARFSQEGRILARLQHPNILPIYEQGEANGVPYLVVQYLDSEASLDDIVGEPMEPARALRLIGQVLAGLEHAHRQGVVHRNLKPANVLLPLPTWPMLTGFEIARLMDDRTRARLTTEGMVIGTPAYMSPEQVFGLPADQRSDLYGVGALLYELLTGRVPFKRDTAKEMLAAHAYDPPPPATGVNPSLPSELEQLLEKALRKDAGARYQSASEMTAAVERLLSIIERSRESDPLLSLYQDGVASFKARHWERAVERLGRLVQLDPYYEDAESLLESAQGQRDAARRDAPPRRGRGSG
jgi:serine/threonine protein kinase